MHEFIKGQGRTWRDTNVVELIVDVNRERPVFRIEVTGLCCVRYRLTLHSKHCAVDGNH